MNSYSVLTAPRRREEILRIVRERPVRSQEELLEALAVRGIEVAQPTLSRDLAELGLVKTSRGYVEAPADLPVPGPSGSGRALEKLEQALAEFALSIEVAGTLVVVRTPPADASPLARAIDSAALAEIVGTIAGDDAIFLATRSAAAAARLKSRLLSPVKPPVRRHRA